MTRNIEEITASVQQASQFIPKMIQEIEHIMVGQRYLVNRLILGLLTGEHILVEGVPGLAKTTAIKTLAQTIEASFKTHSVHTGSAACRPGGYADLPAEDGRVCREARPPFRQHHSGG